MPNPPSISAKSTHVHRRDPSSPQHTSTPTEYLTFGGCNYMGLAHHPKVINAAQNALTQYGLSTSASRQTTGNALPHAELERALIDFTNMPDGILLPDGYTANLAALQSLAALGIKHALLDQRAHSSLFDAAKLAQLTIHTYQHLDHLDAQTTLNTLNEPTVILTDSVFTTDGEIAPLTQLLDLLPTDSPHHLLLDDCHGFTVLGNQGRGTANHLNLAHPNLIITTTLLKGLGCSGGMVLGSNRLIQSAYANSTAYICTTPASPALAAAGLEALNIIKTEPTRRSNLHNTIIETRSMLESHNILTHPDPTPIFAFTLGSVARMTAIELSLLEDRIILPLMHYPNGPAPTYFRLALTADHTTEHIHQLDRALTKAIKAHPEPTTEPTPV